MRQVEEKMIDRVSSVLFKREMRSLAFFTHGWLISPPSVTVSILGIELGLQYTFTKLHALIPTDDLLGHDLLHRVHLWLALVGATQDTTRSSLKIVCKSRSDFIKRMLGLCTYQDNQV